jgi:hypothetical protein
LLTFSSPIKWTENTLFYSITLSTYTFISARSIDEEVQSYVLSRVFYSVICRKLLTTLLRPILTPEQFETTMSGLALVGRLCLNGSLEGRKSDFQNELVLKSNTMKSLFFAQLKPLHFRTIYNHVSEWVGGIDSLSTAAQTIHPYLEDGSKVSLKHFLSEGGPIVSATSKNIRTRLAETMTSDSKEKDDEKEEMGGNTTVNTGIEKRRRKDRNDWKRLSGLGKRPSKPNLEVMGNDESFISANQAISIVMPEDSHLGAYGLGTEVKKTVMVLGTETADEIKKKFIEKVSFCATLFFVYLTPFIY